MPLANLGGKGSGKWQAVIKVTGDSGVVSSAPAIIEL
jgi:hypothetical protein